MLRKFLTRVTMTSDNTCLLSQFTHLWFGLERNEFKEGVEGDHEIMKGCLAGVPPAHWQNHDTPTVLSAVWQDRTYLHLVHPDQDNLALRSVGKNQWMSHPGGHTVSWDGKRPNTPYPGLLSSRSSFDLSGRTVPPRSMGLPSSCFMYSFRMPTDSFTSIFSLARSHLRWKCSLSGKIDLLLHHARICFKRNHNEKDSHEW